MSVDGNFLWVTDISDLGTGQEEISDWNTYMSQLSPTEQLSVMKFVFADDRRRSLISLLLQKAAIRTVLKESSNDNFSIGRTREVILISFLLFFDKLVKIQFNLF